MILGFYAAAKGNGGLKNGGRTVEFWLDCKWLTPTYPLGGSA